MNANVAEASYHVALRIAQRKKPHSIAEELIKPCLLETVKLVCDDGEAKKLEQTVSLSNNTIKRRIEEMSEDILDQVIADMKSSPYFAIQLDESTDVASCCQLTVFTRFYIVSKKT